MSSVDEEKIEIYETIINGINKKIVRYKKEFLDMYKFIRFIDIKHDFGGSRGEILGSSNLNNIITETHNIEATRRNQLSTFKQYPVNGFVNNDNEYQKLIIPYNKDNCNESNIGYIKSLHHDISANYNCVNFKIGQTELIEKNTVLEYSYTDDDIDKDNLINRHFKDKNVVIDTSGIKDLKTMVKKTVHYMSDFIDASKTPNTFVLETDILTDDDKRNLENVVYEFPVSMYDDILISVIIWLDDTQTNLKFYFVLKNNYIDNYNDYNKITDDSDLLIETSIDVKTIVNYIVEKYMNELPNAISEQNIGSDTDYKTLDNIVSILNKKYSVVDFSLDNNDIMDILLNFKTIGDQSRIFDTYILNKLTNLNPILNTKDIHLFRWSILTKSITAYLNSSKGGKKIYIYNNGDPIKYKKSDWGKESIFNPSLIYSSDISLLEEDMDDELLVDSSDISLPKEDMEDDLTSEEQTIRYQQQQDTLLYRAYENIYSHLKSIELKSIIEKLNNKLYEIINHCNNTRIYLLYIYVVLNIIYYTDFVYLFSKVKELPDMPDKINDCKTLYKYYNDTDIKFDYNHFIELILYFNNLQEDNIEHNINLLIKFNDLYFNVYYPKIEILIRTMFYYKNEFSNVIKGSFSQQRIAEKLLTFTTNLNLKLITEYLSIYLTKEYLIERPTTVETTRHLFTISTPHYASVPSTFVPQIQTIGKDININISDYMILEIKEQWNIMKFNLMSMQTGGGFEKYVNKSLIDYYNKKINDTHKSIGIKPVNLYDYMDQIEDLIDLVDVINENTHYYIENFLTLLYYYIEDSKLPKNYKIIYEAYIIQLILFRNLTNIVEDFDLLLKKDEELNIIYQEIFKNKKLQKIISRVRKLIILPKSLETSIAGKKRRQTQKKEKVITDTKLYKRSNTRKKYFPKLITNKKKLQSKLKTFTGGKKINKKTRKPIRIVKHKKTRKIRK